MTALPLLDMALSGAGDSAGHRGEHANTRLARLAGELVRSALADYDQLESLARALAPANEAEFDRSTAIILRCMYERWADDADALLARIAKARGLGVAVERTGELGDAIGRTRAMLSASIEDMERGREDFHKGRVYTMEEVRRELSLPVK